MNDRAIIEEVRQKTDIVALVGTYVTLQRRGQKYVGLCPFHHEKTPSFQVSPDQGLFYCFGCQTGGDVFGFLQNIENLTFSDALRTLAERAGVKLAESRDPREVQRRREREQLYRALDLAARYYQAELQGQRGAGARQYLAGRGVAPEVIERFGLGLAPPGWHNVGEALRRHRLGEQQLLRAGLLSRSAEGRVYDRFRERLMFPIWDVQGRVVGFGGRALTADAQPKYLNSPEGDLFRKSRLLYGAHLARRAIRDAGYTIVVEGYMDAIACHQAGIGNVVASMGTALTAEQGRWLLQQAPDVVIAFDADAAGTNAALRGLDLLSSLGCRVRVLSLPAGSDPDELLRAEGRDGFLKLVEAAESLVQYKLRQAHLHVLGGRMPATPDERARLAHALLPVLAAIPDPVERDVYVRQVAGSFGLREEVLHEQVQQQRSRGSKQGPPQRESRNDSGKFGKTRQTAAVAFAKRWRTPAEMSARDLTALMLRRPDWVPDIKAQLPASAIADPDLQAIVTGLYAGQVVAADWPEERKALVAWLQATGLAGDDPDSEQAIRADRKLMEDCLANLQAYPKMERMAEIERLLREDPNRPDGAQLMKELSELAKERHATSH